MRMKIDKDTIVNFLRSRGEHDKAERAQQELPDRWITKSKQDCWTSSGSIPASCLGNLKGGGLPGFLGGGKASRRTAYRRTRFRRARPWPRLQDAGWYLHGTRSAVERVRAFVGSTSRCVRTLPCVRGRDERDDVHQARLDADHRRVRDITSQTSGFDGSYRSPSRCRACRREVSREDHPALTGLLAPV